MIDISHALTVEGWLTEAEAQYLADTASKCLTAVEVGSWKGRSTCAIASGVRMFVYAVDTWRGSQEHQAELRAKDEDWLLREFLTNIKPLSTKITHKRMMSKTAAWYFTDGYFQGGKFDMIFIDASHDYESVKADILAWTPLLAPGGILCGHDYDPPHWMGVKRAVDECVPKFRIVPGTTIWTTEGA